MVEQEGAETTPLLVVTHCESHFGDFVELAR
jgi:hypothetical protein